MIPETDTMRYLQYLATLLLVSILCACAGRNPNVAWDNQFDFRASRTYDWTPKQPESGPDLPYEAIDSAVKSAVDSAMSSAGFRLSTAEPRLRLTYYVGLEEIEQLTDEAYYGPGWGAYWGYGWYGPDGVNASQYDDGTITIDVLSADPAVGLVWRGIARAQLTPAMSPQQVERAVRGAVNDLLEDFPPQLDG